MGTQAEARPVNSYPHGLMPVRSTFVASVLITVPQVFTVVVAALGTAAFMGGCKQACL